MKALPSCQSAKKHFLQEDDGVLVFDKFISRGGMTLES